jgi:hypothetical protein
MNCRRRLRILPAGGHGGGGGHSGGIVVSGHGGSRSICQFSYN